MKLKIFSNCHFDLQNSTSHVIRNCTYGWKHGVRVQTSFYFEGFDSILYNINNKKVFTNIKVLFGFWKIWSKMLEKENGYKKGLNKSSYLWI